MNNPDPNYHMMLFGFPERGELSETPGAPDVRARLGFMSFHLSFPDKPALVWGTQVRWKHDLPGPPAPQVDGMCGAVEGRPPRSVGRLLCCKLRYP